MTCALRALTLCDQEVLELPEGNLTRCICTMIARYERTGQPAAAEALRHEVHRLSEATLGAPQPSLFADGS